MIAVEDLSPVGFGAYRTSILSESHRTALCKALDHGCNLIDTAPNYANGGSERLIGSVVGGALRRTVFLITKAGYAAQGGLSTGAARALAEARAVDLGNGDTHCLDPAFLEESISGSLSRLATDRADAVLLHNPEHQLAMDGANHAAFLDLLKDAIAAINATVQRGRARYWGISSNRLRAAPAAGFITLSNVLACADAVGAREGFAFVQMPANLVEWDTLSDAAGTGSLVRQAAAEGLTTIANRALSARTAAGGVRLTEACHAEASISLEAAIESLCRAVDEQAALRGQALRILDLPRVQMARDALLAASNPDAVDQVVEMVWRPILDLLFDDGPPPAVRQATIDLVAAARDRARLNGSAQTRRLLNDPQVRARLQGLAPAPLQTLACDSLLRAGFDHVLVGMRQETYVEDFSERFVRHFPHP
ncbi:MAG: aldo/keto reductase [Caulobacter sp.]|nr:aldo/keto reductase [Caulobacter sp.]